MARYSSNRKSTPKVRDGQVQKKNRHAPTRLNSLSVGVGKGPGLVVTSKEDVWKFLRLLPDWKRVSTDLDLIYLSAEIEEEFDGWYESPNRPSITLSAWPEDLRTLPGGDYFDQHADLFDRLGVEITLDDEDLPVCQFDRDSARAFQLLHILLHELGHHHYRITKGRGVSAGDEKYAEAYAHKWERVIWKRYCEAFRFHPAK